MQVQTMDYSCIVFDTAPTGHTLRLLNFPTILQKGLSKLVGLKNSMGGMFTQVSAMLGGAGGQDLPDQVSCGRAAAGGTACTSSPLHGEVVVYVSMCCGMPE